MAPRKFPKKLGIANIEPSKTSFKVRTPLKKKNITTHTSKKYKNRRLFALITEIGWELATYKRMTGGPGIPVNPPVKPPKPPTEKIIRGLRFPLYLMPVLIKINKNIDNIDTLYL